MALSKKGSNEKAARIMQTPKHDSDGVFKLRGCHVPLQSGCIKGTASPKTTEDGVKMECSNANCPFKDAFIHQECFQALENHLVKVMTSIGRGLGDTQRKASVWSRKEAAWVRKYCRCPCSMGILRYDPKAILPIDNDATATAPATAVASPKHKKAKAKKLPKLNFNGSVPVVTVDGDRTGDNKQSKKKPQNKSQRYRSTSLSYKSPSNRAAERQYIRKPSFENASTKPKQTTPTSVLITNMSTAPMPLVFSPRKNCGPVTYAEAAQAALSNTSDYSSENDSRSRRGSSASDSSQLQYGGSNWLQVTESLTDSYKTLSLADQQQNATYIVNSKMFPKATTIKATNQQQEHCTVEGNSNKISEHVTVKIDTTTSSVMLSPPITPPIATENDEEKCQTKTTRKTSVEMGDDGGISMDDDASSYDLFGGYSFGLAEKLLADSVFPGVFC